MPEGHTIHRLARDHQRWFGGQTVGVDSPQGRFGKEAGKLNGRQLCDVSAYGKHLFYEFGGQHIIHVHLGLYGKVRLHKNPAPEPRGAVRLRMIGSQRTFDLNGPNQCELIGRKQQRAVIGRLGADPLRHDACPDQVWNRLRRSRAPLGTLLLNQSVIAGVGNVYRAEILFLMGIDPQTPARKLDRQTFDKLWELTVELLRKGVRYNRIITVPHLPSGKPASRLNSGERLNIYKKSSCPNCHQRVTPRDLGNRTMYACRHCQRWPARVPGMAVAD